MLRVTGGRPPPGFTRRTGHPAGTGPDRRAAAALDQLARRHGGRRSSGWRGQGTDRWRPRPVLGPAGPHVPGPGRLPGRAPKRGLAELTGGRALDGNAARLTDVHLWALATGLGFVALVGVELLSRANDQPGLGALVRLLLAGQFQRADPGPPSPARVSCSSSGPWRIRVGGPGGGRRLRRAADHPPRRRAGPRLRGADGPGPSRAGPGGNASTSGWPSSGAASSSPRPARGRWRLRGPPADPARRGERDPTHPAGRDGGLVPGSVPGPGRIGVWRSGSRE